MINNPIQIKNTIDNQIQAIKDELNNHKGHHALLFQKEYRKLVPILVKITGITNSGATGEQRCYDDKGTIRGTIPHSIDFLKILTNEQKIIYLQDTKHYNKSTS